MKLLNGDCLELLKTLDENSIDSIVTDAPYGLAFMGKRWDYDVPSVEIWKECLRVLKPGGHLLSFGGTRTYHRMVVAIEDAGFEIRDQIQWLYGSGFPKSMDISKAIDKQAGAEREVIEERFKNGNMKGKGYKAEQAGQKSECNITAPATESAKQWQGWGTALKPANEPICLARKPISEKTVAQNVLKHGTGAMNIDECRVETSTEEVNELNRPNKRPGAGASGFMTSTSREFTPSQGRWPANVIFDEEAGKVLDEQVSQTMKMHGAGKASTLKGKKIEGNIFQNSNDVTRIGDSGGASRFFYCAKASKSERNAGLEGMPENTSLYNNTGLKNNENGTVGPVTNSQNFHPTVKPIKLMEYLCKLVTPPNGTVLDPFMGSGTTGVAAKKLNYEFVGIEREKEYYEISVNRIKNAIEKAKVDFEKLKS